MTDLCWVFLQTEESHIFQYLNNFLLNFNKIAIIGTIITFLEIKKVACPQSVQHRYFENTGTFIISYNILKYMSILAQYPCFITGCYCLISTFSRQCKYALDSYLAVCVLVINPNIIFIWLTLQTPSREKSSLARKRELIPPWSGTTCRTF